MASYAVAPCTRSHSRPIRHQLGITAFGVTAWTAHEAGDVVIHEHDADDPTADQELFVVFCGDAVFEVAGVAGRATWTRFVTNRRSRS